MLTELLLKILHMLVQVGRENDFYLHALKQGETLNAKQLCPKGDICLRWEEKHRNISIPNQWGHLFTFCFHIWLLHSKFPIKQRM